MIVLFFEVLTTLLIYFPLLTGGIWGKLNGNFIELSEMIGPALIWLISYAVARYFTSFKLDQLPSVRILQKMLTRIEAFYGRSRGLFLFIYTVIFTFFGSWAAISRHRAFHSSGYDLGIYHNAIWNLTPRKRIHDVGDR